MKNKPVYLCAFGYHRANWIAPLLHIKEEVELVFVYHIYLEMDQVKNFDQKVVYWSDFSSAQDLINKIQPTKIVFMSIDSPLVAALNSVALNKRIETVFLQHGLMHSLKMYDEVQKSGKPLSEANPAPNQKPVRGFILQFFINSIRSYNLSLLWYQLKLTFKERKYSKAIAKSKVFSRHVLASKYIVYTKKNAQVLIERDRISDEMLCPIGIPEFDSFFSESKKEKQGNHDYMLLIDYPMAEVKEYNNTGAGYSKEKVNAMYVALAEYAESNNCALKVKLHPYSYESDFMIEHKNIEYLRAANTEQLILNSKVIFGAVSSLMLPAIIYKPVVLLEVFKSSDFAKNLQNLGMCKSFTIDEVIAGNLIGFSPKYNIEKMQDFIDTYLYKIDGKSMDRARIELLN